MTNTKSRTHLIRIDYPESDWGSDFVLLTLPAEIPAARIDNDTKYWANILRRCDDSWDTAQEFADRVMHGLCNAFPGARWEYVQPFTTINMQELLGASYNR